MRRGTRVEGTAAAQHLRRSCVTSTGYCYHGIDLPKADIKAVLAWLLSGSYGDTIGGPTSP